MFWRKNPFALAAIVTLLTLGAASAYGQVSVHPGRPLAENVIMPQARAYFIPHPAWPVPPHPRPRPAPQVEISAVNAEIEIVEQAAVTTLEISLKNPGPRRQEAELIVPVPDGAAVRSFGFDGVGKEPTAEILPKEEARRIYEEIVFKMRDPALLEFLGYNLVRSSVFPVEPRATQKVTLTYENLLGADGERVDYLLPRSEALGYSVPWQISATIKTKQPISTVYSPSHKIVAERKSDTEYAVALTGPADPGAFRLSYLTERNGVTASLMAYPDPKIGGGYFLLLAGLPAKPPVEKDGPAIKREVTIVLDRSGSMNGEKIEQVREAAKQIVSGLEEHEAFNIISYQATVDLFAESPVLKTPESVKEAREYLDRIQARGGTNIHDALTEALRQKPTEGMLPIVLFLTDGLPTVGNTSERAIREVAMKGNPYSRRVFSFGVGVDVNTPLLEKIAYETRATPTFVLPKEDVEAKVGQVFNRLYGPVLAYPELRTQYQDERKALVPTEEMLPDKLPDLFEGDQLVVLGKYHSEDPIRFTLAGNYLGDKRTFTFSFDLDNATTRNAFVPRLWASRKIAVLIDAIRQLGADSGVPGNRPPSSDPQVKELVEEIVKLSTEFGILTEYTAFLAREGTDLARRDVVMDEARRNFKARAMEVRSGKGSVNQSMNFAAQRAQGSLNLRNEFYDENMNRVSIANVQQINDRAFYRRGNRWVDSRLATLDDAKPDRVVEIGSQDFLELAEKLAGMNRQGTVSLEGEILLRTADEVILVK